MARSTIGYSRGRHLMLIKPFQIKINKNKIKQRIFNRIAFNKCTVIKSGL
jgi:hypothetical protein